MNDAAPEQPDSPPVDEGRRRLCQLALGGMTIAAAGTVGYPVVAFLSLPKSLRQQEAMEISLSDLPEGAAVWGEHMGRQIVVVRTGGEVRVFDGACTHLGCVVQWEGSSLTFKCPCHGAFFDDQGEPISGPVNIPLRRIEFVVKGDVLRIT